MPPPRAAAYSEAVPACRSNRSSPSSTADSNTLSTQNTVSGAASQIRAVSSGDANQPARGSRATTITPAPSNASAVARVQARSRKGRITPGLFTASWPRKRRIDPDRPKSAKAAATATTASTCWASPYCSRLSRLVDNRKTAT